MMERYRRTTAMFLAAGSMCTLTACGSSSNSSSGSGSGSGSGGPGGFKLSSSQKSCLKKHGVTLPSGGFKRPTGANGSTRPKGQFPRSGAQFKVRQAAFKACGVSFPAGGPRGGGTSTSTSAPAS